MPGKSKNWLIRVSLVIAIFSLVAGVLGCDSSSPSVPEVGNEAPDFTVATMAGTKISLSELRGKPVVVNFWATWCGPCRSEMGYIEAVARESGGKIKFVAVNIGESDARERQFFGNSDVSFTVALDSDRYLAAKYAVQYIPTTFFIDSEGIIVDIKVGAFSSEMDLWSSLNTLF
ncbi:MAG: TlpA disulfide reductase family protein [Chloroflexota bacterium]|nr:TlpA disulfide reductase family protein [Chloroflexota bacterium]